MNRIIAALMALILIMTAISAAGCEAKEDPYKGYCTDGELAGGAALQNAKKHGMHHAFRALVFPCFHYSISRRIPRG